MRARRIVPPRTHPLPMSPKGPAMPNAVSHASTRPAKSAKASITSACALPAHMPARKMAAQ